MKPLDNSEMQKYIRRYRNYKAVCALVIVLFVPFAILVLFIFGLSTIPPGQIEISGKVFHLYHFIPEFILGAIAFYIFAASDRMIKKINKGTVSREEVVKFPFDAIAFLYVLILFAVFFGLPFIA